MNGLSERGRALVELMADLGARRTIPEAAQAVGLTAAYAYRLTTTEPFLKALRARVRELVGSELPEVYASLIATAKRGGPAGVGAAKLLLQALGEVDAAGVAVTVNTSFGTGRDFPERVQGLLDERRQALAEVQPRFEPTVTPAEDKPSLTQFDTNSEGGA